MTMNHYACPHCGNLVAIAAEAGGQTFLCPHCQQLLTTPAAPAPAAPPASPASSCNAAPGSGNSGDTLGLPQVSAAGREDAESIFSPPEEDALFAAPPPRIELPGASSSAPPTMRASSMPPAPSGNLEELPQVLEMSSAPVEDAATAFPLETGTPAAAPIAAPPEGPSPLRPRHRPWGLLFLVFLVPYSLIITLAFLYILYLYKARKDIEPFELLPDPDPKGKARPISRLSPDNPLPARLQTTLGQALQIGDLEVKPLAVFLTQEGDLELHLQFRNLSRDTLFNPFPLSFTRPWRGRKPYTYLQAGRLVIEGGSPEWLRGPAGKERMVLGWDGELRPGEEMVAHLITPSRSRPIVRQLLQVPDEMLWRLHVRRGLAEVEGQRVSATAVVGVRFRAHQILRGQPAG